MLDYDRSLARVSQRLVKLSWIDHLIVNVDRISRRVRQGRVNTRYLVISQRSTDSMYRVGFSASTIYNGHVLQPREPYIPLSYFVTYLVNESS